MHRFSWRKKSEMMTQNWPALMIRYIVEYCVDVNATVKRTPKLIFRVFPSFLSLLLLPSVVKTAWGQCRKEKLSKSEESKSISHLGMVFIWELLWLYPHPSKFFSSFLYFFFSLYLIFNHTFTPWLPLTINHNLLFHDKWIILQYCDLLCHSWVVNRVVKLQETILDKDTQPKCSLYGIKWKKS